MGLGSVEVKATPSSVLPLGLQLETFKEENYLIFKDVFRLSEKQLVKLDY